MTAITSPVDTEPPGETFSSSTVPEAGAVLVGTDLSDEGVAAAADAAYRPAKPLDNTDFDLSWRKQMTRVYVTRALTELRQRGRPARK